jgi:hypothetical protein
MQELQAFPQYRYQRFHQPGIPLQLGLMGCQARGGNSEHVAEETQFPETRFLNRHGRDC